MNFNKTIQLKKYTVSLTYYAYINKWFLPLGLAWWNKKSKLRYAYAAGNPVCYYTKLYEISIGFLWHRFVIQWHYKEKVE